MGYPIGNGTQIGGKGAKHRAEVAVTQRTEKIPQRAAGVDL